MPCPTWYSSATASRPGTPRTCFTGWHDVDLTDAGRVRGPGGRASSWPAERDLDLRVLHTSVLTRAIRTAELTLRRGRAVAGCRSAATGGSTSATTAPCRARTRRRPRPSYGDGPGQGVAPQLRHPAAAGRAGRRPRTRPATPATGTCPAEALPATECLADVVARVLPYWDDAIVPDLLAEGPRGGAVLVVAHGNSLRALRKHIDGIGDDDIVGPRDPDRHPLPSTGWMTTSSVSPAATWATPRRPGRRPRPSPARPAEPRLPPRAGRREPGRSSTTAGRLDRAGRSHQAVCPHKRHRERLDGRLQGVRAPLSGADPDDLLDGEDPDLAVTDLAGAAPSSTIASITSSTWASSTRISSRIFGTNSTSYSAPR